MSVKLPPSCKGESLQDFERGDTRVLSFRPLAFIEPRMFTTMLISICSFLYKKSQGFLKKYVKRWFVYNDQNGLLEYFRHKNDSQPLGYVLESGNREKEEAIVLRKADILKERSCEEQSNQRKTHITCSPK